MIIVVEQVFVVADALIDWLILPSAIEKLLL